MAAVVRRHWALILAVPALIIGCILMMLQAGGDSHKAKAQGAVPVPAAARPTAPGTDLDVYNHVTQIRSELALTNPDLAALGLSAGGAKTVLTAIKDFATSSAASITQVDESILQARRSLQETMRKIHVGPRDEAVMASLPTLKQGVASAQSQRDVLLASLVGQINSLLNSDQQALWAAARANATTADQIGSVAPGPYRYVSGLSDSQIQQLDIKARQGGEMALSASDSSLLNALQQDQAQQARQNQQVSAAAVASADAQVLPLPDELKRRQFAGMKAAKQPSQPLK